MQVGALVMAMGRLSNRAILKRASSQLAVAVACHRFYDACNITESQVGGSAIRPDLVGMLIVIIVT